MIRTAHLSSNDRVPTLTAAAQRAVDKLCAERFGIPVEWLMEAAGWQAARVARGRRVTVVCGPGNNGGDGLAAARHLHRWGRLARVACTEPERLAGPAQAEAAALRAGGVAIDSELQLGDDDLIIDALFGTGLNRAPGGKAAEWIAAVNESPAPVLAIDVPSGLQSDDGTALGQTIRATTTITLGLPKPGLFAADGPAYTGELWLADIGVPRQAYSALGVEVPTELFAAGDLIRLSA